MTDEDRTHPTLRRLAESLAMPRTDLPRPIFPQQTTLDAGRLDQLAEILRQPIATPTIGEAAAKSMLNVVETVARDVLALSQDNLDRAHALHAEAESFAKIVREHGEVLADRIRSEAIRGLKVSECMRAARDVIGEALPTDRLDKEEPAAENPPGSGAGDPAAARTA